jgi:UDP-N-acetylmuramate dehydrogenase
MNLMSFRENVYLKDFCTFGIGGPARYFQEIRTIENMQRAVSFCNSRKIPFMILGKGSNCLFDDRGYNGAVLLNKIDFFEQPAPGIIHVGAGYSFALLGVQTARQGWGGLEFASGIPASVGGAVFMNAGANDGETCRSLQTVDYINEDGALELLERSDLAFAYRVSAFQKMNGVIAGAAFALKPHAEARKQQIEIVNMRKKTQPLSEMSAGCTFVNPPCGSAGALIDRCGLKGTGVGGAQVSTKHANFFINTGNATCKEMKALIELVKTRVKEIAGEDLAIEVRYIPFEPEDT